MQRDKDMNLVPVNGYLRDMYDQHKHVFKSSQKIYNGAGLYKHRNIYYFDCPDLPYLWNEHLDLKMEYQYQTTIHSI